MITVVQNPYKSIVVETDEGSITISEGSKIQFIVESTGELRKGVVTKFNGNKEKLEIEIVPSKKEHKETWSIMVMAEGSLKLDREE